MLELLRRRGRLPQEALQRSLGGAAVRAVRRLVRAGLVAERWEMSRQAARPAFDQHLRLAVTVEEAQRAAGDFPLASRRLALLQQVLLEETLDAAQARKEFGADTVRRLVDRGLLAIEAQRRVRDPLADYEQVAEPRLMLTAEQADAVGHIANSVRSGQAGAFLLHGPTGSGKTEVYLRALAACVAVGKRGMLLAPEISLTPQLVARLQSRFPGRVGLLHSGLTAGQHYDTWWRVREGDYDVVLGTRSAVFAPMPDLGLIILDEEHEWTYKQAEMAPRYHARSTAMTLGRLTGATVALGSATPDIATYYVAGRGRLGLLALHDRLRPGDDGVPTPVPLADVEVVDMREELKAGVRSIFSRALIRRPRRHAAARAAGHPLPEPPRLRRDRAVPELRARAVLPKLLFTADLPRRGRPAGVPPVRAAPPHRRRLPSMPQPAHPLPWPGHAARGAGGRAY